MSSRPAEQDWLRQQEQALLDLIKAERAGQCALALDEARRRNETLLAQARADARARLRQTFAEQRQQRHERLAAAAARLATRRRLQEQQHLSALLQQAWVLLPGELCACWHDHAARRRWMQRVLDAARLSMPGGGWLVRHAPDWSAAETAALAGVPAADGAPPRFVADDSIAAGLKVIAGGNVIDGTLSGLLAERADFESRLLRRLEAPR